MGAKRGRDPLLIDVLAELGAGRISEDFIRSESSNYIVEGLCEGRHVTVNPVPAIVDTLLHELIHRARPSWTERTVRSRTKRLVGMLTVAEQEAIYAVYQRVVVKVKRRGRRSA